jgi:hypothetical protein
MRCFFVNIPIILKDLMGMITRHQVEGSEERHQIDKYLVALPLDLKILQSLRQS